jgi:hypothetical protein
MARSAKHTRRRSLKKQQRRHEAPMNAVNFKKKLSTAQYTPNNTPHQQPVRRNSVMCGSSAIV